MAVDGPRREDLAVARHHLGGRADDKAGGNPVHHIGVARFADGCDAPVPDANVSLENSRIVEHQGAGYH